MLVLHCHVIYYRNRRARKHSRSYFTSHQRNRQTLKYRVKKNNRSADGDSGAWKRRLLIIRFEAPPPAKKIPHFADLLIKEEGSGILNWALQGLGMLLQDIQTGGDIALSAAQVRIVDGLLAESDSLRHFLIENVVSDEDADLTVTEIIEAYAEYCPLKGWDPKPITVIQRELERLMLELFKTTKSNSIMRTDKDDGKERSHRGFRRVAFRDKEYGT